MLEHSLCFQLLKAPIRYAVTATMPDVTTSPNSFHWKKGKRQKNQVHRSRKRKKSGLGVSTINCKREREREKTQNYLDPHNLHACEPIAKE